MFWVVKISVSLTWDSSFECSQHMLWLSNKKNIFLIHILIWRHENKIGEFTADWFDQQIVVISYLFACSVIFHAFLLSADFFQNQLFRKILFTTPSECQTIWIQIGPGVLSGLILVQTVCKSYQQTTKRDSDKATIHYNITKKRYFSLFLLHADI